MTQEQWERLRELLPPERKAKGGRPAKDNRLIVNAIVYWLNTGIAWRDLPERFGPWNTVYTRFSRWSKQGIWEKAFEQMVLSDIVDQGSIMLDSTIVRVHQHGNVPKKDALKKR